MDFADVIYGWLLWAFYPVRPNNKWDKERLILSQGQCKDLTIKAG